MSKDLRLLLNKQVVVILLIISIRLLSHNIRLLRKNGGLLFVLPRLLHKFGHILHLILNRLLYKFLRGLLPTLLSEFPLHPIRLLNKLSLRVNHVSHIRFSINWLLHHSRLLKLLKRLLKLLNRLLHHNRRLITLRIFILSGHILFRRL